MRMYSHTRIGSIGACTCAVSQNPVAHIVHRKHQRIVRALLCQQELDPLPAPAFARLSDLLVSFGYAGSSTAPSNSGAGA